MQAMRRRVERTRAAGARRSLAVAVAAALLVACAIGGWNARAGEIADLYAELVEPTGAAAQEAPSGEVLRSVPDRPPEPDIVRIGLERVPGYTGGPRYWVVIDSTGDFRYVGEENVDRLGEHTGTVPGGSLRLLLAYVHEIGFRQLEDTYTSRFLDNPTSYLMAEWPDETKVILNYAYSGPARLWALGRMIDDLLEEATWSTD